MVPPPQLSFQNQVQIFQQPVLAFYLSLISTLTTCYPSLSFPKLPMGAEMHPVGRLPTHFKIGDKEHLDDLLIHPNVTGTLMSWKTNKGLPDCYPNPTVTSFTVTSVASASATMKLLVYCLISTWQLGVPFCI